MSKKRKPKSGTTEIRPSPVEADLRYIGDKISDVAVEAQRMGMNTAFVVIAHDPFSQTDDAIEGFCGSIYQAVGGLRHYLKRLEK